jgi:NitT/TauT family transport system substrate-binding protein
MIKSKLVSAVLVALAGITATPAFAQSAPAGGETVRFQQLPGVIGLISQVMVDRGFCAKHGIQCVPVPNPSGVVGLQALLSGGLEVSVAAVISAIQLAAKGAPIRLVGTLWQKNPYIFAIGNSEASANLPKDKKAMMQQLRGKRIGVTTRGSGTEYVVDAFLGEAGMKLTDVTIVPVGGPSTAYAALVNKQIDAAVSYEPMGAFCSVLKTCRVYAMLGQGEWPKELDALDGAQLPFVMRSDYVAKNPKVVAAFQNALRDSEAYIKSASFDELLRISKKNFSLDNPRADELLASTLRNSLPGYVSRIDAKAVQAASDYMLRTGQLDKPFDTSGLVAQ